MSAPITWRNVAAPDAAASIREFRQAGQDLGAAFRGLGNVVSTYGDKKADIETENFIADLNNAPDEATRQQMVAQASRAFLNMKDVTQAQRSAELHDFKRAEEAFQAAYRPGQLTAQQQQLRKGEVAATVAEQTQQAQIDEQIARSESAVANAEVDTGTVKTRIDKAGVDLTAARNRLLYDKNADTRAGDANTRANEEAARQAQKERERLADRLADKPNVERGREVLAGTQKETIYQQEQKIDDRAVGKHVIDAGEVFNQLLAQNPQTSNLTRDNPAAYNPQTQTVLTDALVTQLRQQYPKASDAKLRERAKELIGLAGMDSAFASGAADAALATKLAEIKRVGAAQRAQSDVELDNAIANKGVDATITDRYLARVSNLVDGDGEKLAVIREKARDQLTKAAKTLKAALRGSVPADIKWDAAFERSVNLGIIRLLDSAQPNDNAFADFGKIDDVTLPGISNLGSANARELIPLFKDAVIGGSQTGSPDLIDVINRFQARNRQNAPTFNAGGRRTAPQ